MADVFISYKREDRDRVVTLARAIEQRGYTVWWDFDLVSGERWSKRIKAELDAALCVVVVWSRNSVEADQTYVSEWVENEADLAAGKGILVPVLIDPGRIAWTHSKIQLSDLSTWSGEPDHPGLVALMAGITRHAGERTPPEVAEMEAWKQVEDSEDVAAFRRFLAENPNSRFADIARSRVAEFEEPEIPVAKPKPAPRQERTSRRKADRTRPGDEKTSSPVVSILMVITLMVLCGAVFAAQFMPVALFPLFPEVFGIEFETLAAVRTLGAILGAMLGILGGWFMDKKWLSAGAAMALSITAWGFLAWSLFGFWGFDGAVTITLAIAALGLFGPACFGALARRFQPSVIATGLVLSAGLTGVWWASASARAVLEGELYYEQLTFLFGPVLLVLGLVVGAAVLLIWLINRTRRQDRPGPTTTPTQAGGRWVPLLIAFFGSTLSALVAPAAHAELIETGMPLDFGRHISHVAGITIVMVFAGIIAAFRDSAPGSFAIAVAVAYLIAGVVPLFFAVNAVSISVTMALFTAATVPLLVLCQLRGPASQYVLSTALLLAVMATSSILSGTLIFGLGLLPSRDMLAAIGIASIVLAVVSFFALRPPREDVSREAESF